MQTGDWRHAAVGGLAAGLRECRSGFRLPRIRRADGRVIVDAGSLGVVAVCALAAWLYDHSLLTAAGIGSLGLDVWRLLGRAAPRRESAGRVRRAEDASRSRTEEEA